MRQQLVPIQLCSKVLVMLAVLGILASTVTACGANQAGDISDTATPEAMTPIATVAPNVRALPDETTVAEATPSIGTAELAATDIAESVQREATEVAQELDEEATEIVQDLQQARPDPDVVETSTPADAQVQVIELRDYLGQSVSVQGSITELIGQHAFLLQDPVLLDGEEALVIYDQVDFTLSEGQNLLIGGEVHPFDLNQLEQTTSLDLPDEQLMALQIDVVVIADAITRM
jgi:hypothetical protein